MKASTLIWVQVVLGVIAAGATAAAAWYARDAARFGQKAAEAAHRALELTEQTLATARETVQLTERARREDEGDRQRRRLERIGELVEVIFWESNDQTASGPDRWQAARNELRHALVGLHKQLPQCVDVVNLSSSAKQAFAMASRARSEVEQALREVAEPT
jgi:hypothetical protein